MKKSQIKGDIEEKISSKLNELIQELQIEKGRSISKVINESAKKIAKTVSKKVIKATKDKVSDKKVDVSKPGKIKITASAAPENLIQTKPGLNHTKSASSPKPSLKVENKPTPLKNPTQSKNRAGLLRRAKEKANHQ
jgi:hypothetical protein